MLLTDGAMYVAEHGGGNGAFWLMDAIASHQPEALKHPSLMRFQVWTLDVRDGETRSATLTCKADSDQPALIQQEIEYTDFDAGGIELWCLPMTETDRVIMLPSEY